MRSILNRLPTMPAGNVADADADKLFYAISDAVMAAVAPSGLDPSKPEHQRSILRAVGGTMALFAFSAAVAGLSKEEAASIIRSGFDSKFEADTLTGEQPS